MAKKFEIKELSLESVGLVQNCGCSKAGCCMASFHKAIEAKKKGK